MSRRKRNIIGRIYITNDSLFSRDGFSKPNRRVVSINNSKNNMHVVKIVGLYDKNGHLRKNLIPIERYNCLTKDSGIHPKVYKKTARNNPIKEQFLHKTSSRLNKWDWQKIRHLK